MLGRGWSPRQSLWSATPRWVCRHLTLSPPSQRETKRMPSARPLLFISFLPPEILPTHMSFLYCHACTSPVKFDFYVARQIDEVYRSQSQIYVGVNSLSTKLHSCKCKSSKLEHPWSKSSKKCCNNQWICWSLKEIYFIMNYLSFSVYYSFYYNLNFVFMLIQ